MSSLIRLQPETFSRLVEEASRRNKTVDATADGILREHLPVIHDTDSTLATLGRLKQLRARMKSGKEQSGSSRKDAGSSNGASLEPYCSCSTRGA